MDYYRLTESFAGYPAGCVFYLVENMDYYVNTMAGSGYCRSLWIGSPSDPVPRDPLSFWCLTKSCLAANRQFFEKVIPITRSDGCLEWMKAKV